MIRIIENMCRTTEYGVKRQGGITPFFSPLASGKVVTLARHYSILLSMTLEIFLQGSEVLEWEKKKLNFCCMQMT